MPCLPNIQTIQDLDFSLVNDAVNWATNSLNPVQTVSGQLILNPSAIDSNFDRPLGSVDPANNRIRIRCKFQLDTTIGSGPNTAQVVFQLLAGGAVIEESCADFANLDGAVYNYFLDRVYSFSSDPGALTLRISIPTGWQYRARLDYLIAEDFLFCEDNQRAYFILEDFFEEMRTSMSSGLELLAWEIGGAETLTTDFFTENSPGANPLATWLFAEADLDGLNRVSDDISPNSFNPFVQEFGLDYDIPSFYSGLPLGTISGSDYGPGILKLGILKPEILNGALEQRRGAFFIDLDRSQDLRIVFRALVNKNSASVFSNPDIYRTYTIQWDSVLCQKSFSYVDELTGTTVDQANNGFLQGITNQLDEQAVILCSETKNGSVLGNTVFEIDFGNDVGIVGFNYNAFGVPDRFIIDWDGNVIDTGFVGSDAYDAQLLAAGVLPGDINTTPAPGNGVGQITFNKTTATPNRATVTVISPIDSGWSVEGLCLGTIPPTCSISTLTPSVNINENITFDLAAADIDGTIASYLVEYGDGSSDSGVGAPPASVVKSYSSPGNRTAVLTVTDNDGNICQSQVTVRINLVAGEISIDSESSSNCQSCIKWTVNVPQGETRTVEVTGVFAAPATWGTSFCGDPLVDGEGVSADLVEVISADKSYFTGIDAASGANNTLNSQIIITVKDGPTTTDQYILSRDHGSQIC